MPDEFPSSVLVHSMIYRQESMTFMSPVELTTVYFLPEMPAYKAVFREICIESIDFEFEIV